MADSAAFGVVLGALDGLHLPAAGGAAAGCYKEWQHFCLLDEGQGLHAIVNLNLAGHLGGRWATGAARVLMAVWERGQGWQGDVDTIPGREQALAGRAVDMRLGLSRLSFDGGSYRLQAANRRGTLALALEFRPLAMPIMMRNNTPVGSGLINWLVAPRFAASGTVRVEERCYRVQDAPAYHDHNWGAWQWGDDFAWQWGFGLSAGQAGGGPVVVFDRTTDRRNLAVKELTLALWQEGALARTFTRREIVAGGEGFLRCGRLPRLPPVMALVEPQASHDIPARFNVSARANADRLEVEFRAESAVQVVVPNDADLGNTLINEVLGHVAARGAVRGQAVDFYGPACFEFLT